MMELTAPPTQEAIDTSADAPIWRYMDLPRFVSMVSTRTLRFTKAATFRDDPWEGFSTVPLRELPAVQNQVATRSEKINKIIENGWRDVSENIWLSAPELLHVNSWCLSSESMAMWEIYGSRGFGLALKSSVARYRQAARLGVPSSPYRFDAVSYPTNLPSLAEISRDFRRGPLIGGSSFDQDLLKLAFHKRDCYAYEKEWRGVLYRNPRPEGGVDIDFDLDELISEVYIGPRAEDFFHDAVQAIMDKFQLQKPLQRSTLLKAPEKERAESARS